MPIHNDLVRRKKMKGKMIGIGTSAITSGMNGTPGFKAAQTVKGITMAVVKSSLTIKLMAMAPV